MLSVQGFGTIPEEEARRLVNNLPRLDPAKVGCGEVYVETVPTEENNTSRSILYISPAPSGSSGPQILKHGHEEGVTETYTIDDMERNLGEKFTHTCMDGDEHELWNIGPGWLRVLSEKTIV